LLESISSKRWTIFAPVVIVNFSTSSPSTSRAADSRSGTGGCSARRQSPTDTSLQSPPRPAADRCGP
jgi:hypothetical protein